MSTEKQIDEMAKLICNFPQCINYNSIGECKPTECQIADKAEALYNAGYRKQSEGEWLEIDDGVLIGDGKHLECSECGVWKKDRQRSNFCSRCGARMRGGAE